MTAAFSAALESASTATAEASPASTPATETTPAANAEAATTAQPAGEAPAPVSVSAEEPKKEPPTWRWQDILDNARKEHDDIGYKRAKAEYEQQYAGFSGLSAEERQGLLVWNNALRGDPSALAQVAQVNPQLAAALGHQGQSAPEPEPQPDAAIQLPDGSTVGVFTAEGQRKHAEWLAKQLRSQITEEFKPQLSVADRIRQREEQEQRWQQELANANRSIAPLKKLPYFEEFKAELSKALQEIPQGFQGDATEVLYDTYVKLHTAKVNQLSAQGESKALANLQQRAIAGTSNPNAASNTTPPKFKPGADGFAEALRHFGGAS